LTEKKELALRRETWEQESLSGPDKVYTKNETEKIETYGFFLRFIRAQFEPCEDCQTEILKILKTNPLNLSKETTHISFHQCIVSENTGEIYYQFGFPFLVSTNQKWTPCQKCQKILADLMNNAEQLHIGNNEFAEPVELWMKYVLDEDHWKEVERRPSTPEEQIRLKNTNWV
jgi:uncharacterized protein with PIN domain